MRAWQLGRAWWLFGPLLIVASAAGGYVASSRDATDSSPDYIRNSEAFQRAEETFLNNYRIMNKALYAGDTGKRGYYVTIRLDGRDYETAVSAGCYREAAVGNYLALACR